jgi:broad specificity phosphatase PhoE
LRTLEVRRHSLRKAGGGSQLSQAGVDFARRVGARIGPFDRVAGSVVARTRETAIAMGFAVDEELAPLISHEEAAAAFEAAAWSSAAQPFAALAALVAGGGAVWRYASGIAADWRDLVLAMPDGGAALVIGHSGELEAGLVACLPSADHAAWGAAFAPLEGARLTIDGDPPWFKTVEILREAQA